MVIAVTAMATATSAVRPWAARALFGLRRFDDAGWLARAEAPRCCCWLRLAQQGIRREPSDGPWQAYSYLSWHVYASVRATTDKLVPWFAGEE